MRNTVFAFACLLPTLASADILYAANVRVNAVNMTEAVVTLRPEATARRYYVQCTFFNTRGDAVDTYPAHFHNVIAGQDHHAKVYSAQLNIMEVKCRRDY